MTKIRNPEQLLDRISNESKVRKRELILIRQMLPPAEPSPAPFSLRIAPVMAYAHWEGFVKESATAYLLFLSRKTLALSRLKPNMQALACRSELIGAAQATKRIAPYLGVINKLVDKLSESVTIPSNAIDTESNLNWDVFENICTIVGISVDGFWSDHRGLIDGMFRDRCEVAHGQLFTPEARDSIQYLDFVIQAIDRFGTQLENAATTDAHLR